MGVTGDWNDLKRMIQSMERLESSDSMVDIHDRLARTTLREIDRGFRTQSDPQGAPWEPLKFRNGLILQDKGDLRRGFRAESVSATGFEIVNDEKYAIVHQEGLVRTGKVIFPIPDVQAGKSFVGLGGGKSRRNPDSRAMRRKLEGAKKWVVAPNGVVIPPRPMLPEDILPEKWEEAYGRDVANYLEDLFRNGSS